MKAAVVYSSKTGFTRKYAHWIAEDLSLEAYDLKYDLNEVKNLKEVLSGIDTLIFGGGLYAIGINGLKKVMDEDQVDGIPNVFVFCTGLSLRSEEVQREIFENNLKDVEKKNVKLYYYRGGFDFRKLSFIDRLLMRLMKLKIDMKKKKRPLTSDEKGMLAVFHRQVDFTDRELIRDLVQEVQSL
ncbi:flavodoxin domain-containing protein [Proteiniclasticum sp. C24MP]|uniref:flavodoxin domain-containing protein n=1 Tax=Proteiniclasticum sp. C24MP TaxID=3374101 RepID=UPI003754D87D